MAIRIVRLGSPRAKNEGLRIGTVRYPPRGVPKKMHSKLDFYDVWLPELSPSVSLLQRLKRKGSTPASWKSFLASFEKELGRSQQGRIIELLAGLSRSTNFSIGCYCQAEEECHRSVLRKVLIKHGAKVFR